MTTKITEEKICPKCDGEGRVRNQWGVEIRCKACRGKGKITVTKTIEE